MRLTEKSSKLASERVIQQHWFNQKYFYLFSPEASVIKILYIFQQNLLEFSIKEWPTLCHPVYRQTSFQHRRYIFNVFVPQSQSHSTSLTIFFSSLFSKSFKIYLVQCLIFCATPLKKGIIDLTSSISFSSSVFLSFSPEPITSFLVLTLDT